MSDRRQRMIDALNSLEFVDWSASCGELEYVLAAATEENIKTLLNAGFTKEMIDESRDHQEDNDIDLTYLAVNYANIYCWHNDRGFVEEDELNELLAKEQAERVRKEKGMKIVLLCCNCGKEHSDVPLNQRPYLCECGGYVVSPSGKIQGKWIDESTVYGIDCRDGKCE